MKKSLFILLSLVLIASFALTACGGAAPATEEPMEEAPVAEEPMEEPTEEPMEEPAAEEPAAPAGTLRIWADDTRAPILEDLADEVLAAYNLELVVELKSDIRDDFQVAAPIGEGPDIIVIAHDQAGTLVSNGLLSPVDLGDKIDDFAPVAVGACTFDGEVYCMPYATENMGFFYNTDMVEAAPETWDEVLTVGRELVAAGDTTYVMAVTGTTYDVYPLFTAFGGYIFGKADNGDWNPEDLGVGSQGMIDALLGWLTALPMAACPPTGIGRTTTLSSKPAKLPSLWLVLGRLTASANLVFLMLSPTSPAAAIPSLVPRVSSSTYRAKMFS